MSGQSRTLGQSFLKAVNNPVWDALGDKELKTVVPSSKDLIKIRNKSRLNLLMSRCQRAIKRSSIGQPALNSCQKWLKSITHGREDVPDSVDSGADVARILLRAQGFSGQFNRESRESFATGMKTLIAELPEKYAIEVVDAIMEALCGTIEDSIAISMLHQRVSGHVMSPPPIWLPLWDRGLRISFKDGDTPSINFQHVPLKPFWNCDLV